MKQTIELPSVIYGTSSLGNLYEALPYERKLAIIKESVENAPNGIVVFDTAGKYGAGLALETIEQCLTELNVDPAKVIVSNKLAWYRVPLTTEEPTFEPGVWKDLKYDAIQKISYQGILDCYEQGDTLLGKYATQFVSVHDPDEYLAAATDALDEEKRYADILAAYTALQELKEAGKVTAIGIGSKDWTTIQRIAKDVELDWVMIANSLTLHSHPAALIDFIAELHAKGVVVINSAVFNGGFLIGSDYYNYKLVDKNTTEGAAMYAWRERFFELCTQYDIDPAEACFNYGFNIPGVVSVALSTTKPEKVKSNVAMATRSIPTAFWDAMKQEGLL